MSAEPRRWFGSRIGPDGAAVSGPARIGRRTKDLIIRLAPGDVAVIDHEDLDRIAAEGLIEAGPAAIVNASASISGRYPNVGPLLVAAAGIPLIDGVGTDVLDAVDDGARVWVVDDRILLDGEEIASGTRQDLHTLEAAYESARQSIDVEVARFAANTLDYIQREKHLLTDPPDLPDVPVDFKGRHVLIVVRGHDYREDLNALRRGGYINEMRPILIGVDGGADALVEIGEQPDVIVGDFDSVSTSTLTAGASLIVHAYPGGKAPGSDRLAELGLEYHVMESNGTSEDIAMLLAYERGAELIVAVGTHNSMVEFLDKGRAGMASTFLVRLKVGPILVDAKGVNRLYHQTVRNRDLAMLIGAAMVALAVAVGLSQPFHLFLSSFWLWLKNLVP